MKLKLDDDGHVVVEDGKPVYVHDDGKESAFDAPGTVATISRLNAEAKGHREAKEAAEARLKPFEGIEDAEAAIKALEQAKNIKDGELVAAGKVEEIKVAAKKAAEEQVAAAAKANAEKIKELEEAVSSRTAELYDEKIGGSFSRSEYITKNMNLPGPAAQKIFGDHFKIEDGKAVAYDALGNKIFSRARPGDVADFDEALGILVDQYPYRDSLLKGGGSGSGKQPGQGGPGGQKMMTRKEFDGLAQHERASRLKDGYKVTDTA